MPAAAVPGLTHALATFVAEFDGRDLPPAVQAEATRAFVNAVGGMLGGARHDAVERTFRTALPFSGGAQATVFGRRETLGALDAALVNCQASPRREESMVPTARPARRRVHGWAMPTRS